VAGINWLWLGSNGNIQLVQVGIQLQDSTGSGQDAVAGCNWLWLGSNGNIQLVQVEIQLQNSTGLG